jgi:hypothetical protein
MKAYLSDGLEVPDSHIFFLSNTAATRDGIITSFWRDLINNESIEDGDTIIIFYAGHGSRASAPTGWIAADGQIETILPHDVGTRDPEGEQISPIPDCTINELLRKLATAKGNNIVGVLTLYSAVLDLVPRPSFSTAVTLVVSPGPTPNELFVSQNFLTRSPKHSTITYCPQNSLAMGGERWLVSDMMPCPHTYSLQLVGKTRMHTRIRLLVGSFVVRLQRVLSTSLVNSRGWIKSQIPT